ncbi:transketolase [Elioraea sp.]|uniref:transketolase family protein n=1 Tax=Elioraea sp. TaxID=2185103 RepID=UPI0025C10060|nr:transketolase [Elioraea sp.]
MSNVDPRRMADAIRILTVDACERVGEGHWGTPLGAAEIATALFTRHLRFNPADPTWFDRDRFVQSNGHGSMLLYSLLHLAGYAHMPLSALKTFREIGSICQGHPERETEAGIEITTGMLGQGIANATGMAVAEAYLSHLLGPGIVDHRTWALVGDGCLQEGIAQEVISLAGHLRLGKMTWLWDDNLIQDDGGVEQSVSEDVDARFRASGWHVQRVDGHDIEAVSAAIAAAKSDPRPSLIACRTVIGRGVPGLEGTRYAHAGRLTRENTDAARAALGWEGEAFAVPDDILAAWRMAGRRAEAEHAAWQARVAALPEEKRALVARLQAGHLPEGWQESLRAYARDAAGRSEFGIFFSGEIVDRLAAAIPELLSGAPDLEAATKHKRSLTAFTAEDRGGRYVHYGVREHAMGAMLNGMVAHGGVLPVGVTYLVFADYERPTFRLAAMMGLPTVFVFSHDSIGIGRNGPTHQPVEILASLRAIPNMLVFRPADGVEAAEAWELALANRTGPSCLVFPRQKLGPARAAVTVGENLSARGAYVLAEAEGGARRATLLATGTEVAIALAARAMLQAEGVPTAVVSMPCWALFERQDEAYRTAVLGPRTARVAVEAAVRLGWDRYVGPDGGFVGMSGFGTSGAEDALYRHFGITPKAVVAEVRARL